MTRAMGHCTRDEDRDEDEGGTWTWENEDSNKQGGVDGDLDEN